MDSETVQDVTWLLEFAKKWYVDHPGQQIPLNSWMKNVGQAVDDSDPWIVCDGAYSVRPTSHHIIPALAAISLGATTEFILKTIQHHEITCNHISQTVFDLVNGSDPGQEGLSAWNANRMLIDAIMLDEEMTNKFNAEYDEFGLSYELEMAWLLCEHAKFLPVERIKRHLNNVVLGTVDTSREVPDVTSCYVFLQESSYFQGLSDEKILTTLERTGNLTLGLTRENGFILGNAYGFFRDLLLSLDNYPKNPNAERIVEVINRLEDSQMIDTIKARLLEGFMEYDSRSINGHRLLWCMGNFLEESRYGSIRQNLALNLRILSVKDRSEQQASSFALFYGNPLIKNLGNSAGSVLQQLLCELRVINPKDFRFPHFDAVRVLLRSSTMLDEPIENLWPELLRVALRALDAYREMPRHSDYKLIEAANNALEGLIRHVAMAKDIDYKSFAQFASESKTLLCANGFDIRRLPGISRSDKGKFLNDELGL